MKTETLCYAIGNIDERLIERAEKPVSRRPRYLRYIAAAAAVLLIFGAAFGIAKAAGEGENKPEQNALVPETIVPEDAVQPSPENSGTQLSEKYAFMADTTVPADAVLPPSQMGKDGSCFMPGHEDLLNIKRIYEESDVVCIVTIRDWLGETEPKLYTFYEAKVEQIYKGEPAESIVVCQAGSSEGLFNSTPLFTYGDKLLLGLCRNEKRPYPNAYDIIGMETTVSYLATAEDGKVYVIDEVGEYSYWTRLECPELHFTNYADDQTLVKELYKDIANYDSAFSKFHEGYWQGYYEDRETFLHDTAGYAPHVYSLEEIESFFSELNGIEGQ